jgi:hypothetical protein
MKKFYPSNLYVVRKALEEWAGYGVDAELEIPTSLMASDDGSHDGTDLHVWFY